MPTHYNSAAAITAHSSNPNIFDAILVLTTGDLTVAPAQGASVTMTGVPAGTLVPIRTRLVTACPANTVGLRY
jgi:hypothetical protein